MVIDEYTGEILGVGYETNPYKHKDDVKPIVFLSEVRSVDDMEYFMKAMVDKREVRGSNHNDLLGFFESCLGYKALKHEIFKNTPHMTVPQFKLLDKLGKLVEYKNVIMTTREELCEYLGCKDNNLMKKLKPVEGYIEVYTHEDGIRKGEIKILMNPKFFYVYEYGLYDTSRDEEIKKWYAGRLIKQSNL